MENMKSDGAIRTDIYHYIKNSELDKATNGIVTKKLRPAKSHKEDIVISILSNEGVQSQTAIINVNIYVQDDNIEGQFEEKTVRVDELCAIAWIHLEHFRTDEYVARAISQRVYPTDSGEHIINNQIEYKTLND